MRSMMISAAMLLALSASGANAADHPILQVQVGPGIPGQVSGRLLIFAEPLAAAKADAKGGVIESVEADPFSGEGQVAAREVGTVAAGAVLDIDLDGRAAPKLFSRLPPGEYAVQAVLDQDHSYNYNGRGGGDLVSPVTTITLPLAAGTKLVLDKVEPDYDPFKLPPQAPKAAVDRLAAAKPHIAPVNFVSPALSAFFGRPITMKGWVLTPPGYETDKARYPTAYYTHGFGGSNPYLVGQATRMYDLMAPGARP